jgi:hypothetical protein
MISGSPFAPVGKVGLRSRLIEEYKLDLLFRPTAELQRLVEEQQHNQKVALEAAKQWRRWSAADVDCRGALAAKAAKGGNVGGNANTPCHNAVWRRS